VCSHQLALQLGAGGACAGAQTRVRSNQAQRSGCLVCGVVSRPGGAAGPLHHGTRLLLEHLNTLTVKPWKKSLIPASPMEYGRPFSFNTELSAPSDTVSTGEIGSTGIKLLSAASGSCWEAGASTAERSDGLCIAESSHVEAHTPKHSMHRLKEAGCHHEHRKSPRGQGFLDRLFAYSGAPLLLVDARSQSRCRL